MAKARKECTHNVFISWSADYSKDIARILKETLPMVHPGLKPFYSPDIPTGKRGYDCIWKAMNTVKCGISCVTEENQRNPWLLFEAGYVSAKTNTMCIFLVDFPTGQPAANPLALLQGCWLNEEGFRKLIGDVIDACELPDNEQRREQAISQTWPEFEKKVRQCIEKHRSGAAVQKKEDKALEKAAQEEKSDPLTPEQKDVISRLKKFPKITRAAWFIRAILGEEEIKKKSYNFVSGNGRVTNWWTAKRMVPNEEWNLSVVGHTFNNLPIIIKAYEAEVRKLLESNNIEEYE